MTSGKSKKVKSKISDDHQELFSDGWLNEQLTAVVSELASRAPQDQPRLTGSRSASMADPAWLLTHQG